MSYCYGSFSYETEYIDFLARQNATVVRIGNTTTGAPGTDAIVTNTGVRPVAELNFTIPRGDQGAQGAQGAQGVPGVPGVPGAPGAPGPGVPVGGTTTQVLVKVNNTDYNTQWIDGVAVGIPTAVRYSPVFQATELTFTGAGNTYPTFNSYYVKFGQIVTFNIKVILTTVINFGTGQYKLQLPFAPIAPSINHFTAWAWVNPSSNPDGLNGHIVMVADHLPGDQTIDLHWTAATTADPKPVIERPFSQASPVTLTVNSLIYVNGTYISAV